MPMSNTTNFYKKVETGNLHTGSGDQNIGYLQGKNADYDKRTEECNKTNFISEVKANNTHTGSGNQNDGRSKNKNEGVDKRPDIISTMSGEYSKPLEKPRKMFVVITTILMIILAIIAVTDIRIETGLKFDLRPWVSRLISPSGQSTQESNTIP